MRRLGLLLLAIALAFQPLASPAAETIWLETELFGDLGGWTNDAQFIDQMGSPFLLSIGLKKPVEDAKTEVEVPSADEYRLWVRCRDWLPEHSPGRFQVALGEKTVHFEFGASKKPGWIWEDGGTHRLARGRLTVRLKDCTGHYARCDAIVLTSDPSYRPPDDLDKLAADRIAHGGVSREVKDMGPYDTVVVGGGLAGTFAAVASARMGCKTALIQNRPVLGGNGSEEILVNPEGDTTREPLDPGEGGIIEEVRGPVQQYSKRMLALVEAEPNLDLFLNTHATDVEMEDADELEAVLAIHTRTKQRMRFSGRVFIDCTGDGAIGVWAGVEHRHGREPRSMYNETRAPEVGDSHTMGGTLRYATELRAGPVEFQRPAWAYEFGACDDFGPKRHPQIHFGGWQWVIEYGGMKNTYDDAEHIRDELLRIIWGMWDHVKNECPRLKKEARDYELVWVSHVVGKRESRRLIGDYVMTEHDIGGQTLFPDRVSYGGWGVDLHPPGGFWDKGPPAEFSHKVKFSVPYRSLYSKDLENLLMAGRCISVSHAALGATRVMITCGLQGQAVGTAAGVCKRRRCSPKGLYPNYVEELQQQLLEDGCYLIDLPNRDPKDLALSAKATASSVASPDTYKAESKLTVHPLTCDRAVMFKVAADRIDTITLYLHSEKDTPAEVKLGLRPAKTLGDFSATENLAEAAATVPPQSEGWIELELAAEVKPGLYYAWLQASPGLGWSLFGTKPPETARAYRTRDAWKPMPDCYTFRLDPPSESQKADVARTPPKETMFVASNVNNGFARAIRGWPNSWRPDPKNPLPQWVELDFGSPVEVNAVHVSFQSSAMRAEDFRIEAAEGDQWKTLATIAGNKDRRRVISFERVKVAKLRLVVIKAAPDMGVCEIRAYGE